MKLIPWKEEKKGNDHVLTDCHTAGRFGPDVGRNLGAKAGSATDDPAPKS